MYIYKNFVKKYAIQIKLKLIIFSWLIYLFI